MSAAVSLMTVVLLMNYNTSTNQTVQVVCEMAEPIGSAAINPILIIGAIGAALILASLTFKVYEHYKKGDN